MDIVIDVFGWIGFSITCIVVSCFLFFGLYKLFEVPLSHGWYKFKHLFPRWQWTKNNIKEWEEIISTATDWRGKCEIKVKGQLIILKSPKNHEKLNGKIRYHKQYILLKKG